ncbi:MAG: cation:proton antiporter, partial [Clostridiales bacterium]|nr:cation:proton antiporter [Clostridiales bacterium]
MEAYTIFRSLCIIVITAKVFGLVARKLKAPQVVGEIAAGVVLGPSALGLVEQSDFLMQMAEIGVVLIMFSAGLQTNLHDLIKTGFKSFLIACAGVFVPLAGGSILYFIFYGISPLGSPEFFKAVFIGVIMTATSVSITVQTLKELGKIGTQVGTTILSAAIIDDVLGIIVLTFVIGINGGQVKPFTVVAKTVLFFVFALILGFIIYKIFKFSDKRWPHTRRIPIMGLALCLGLAYIAEKYFGIADITGAYVAGIILCNIRDSKYIAEKMDISSYMLFGPIFFASIGLRTDFDKISTQIIFFAIGFVLTAMICKVIGCYLMSRACRFTRLDSVKIGVGMMTRGEVALIVAQKGLSSSIISSAYFTPVILLIL